MARDDDLRPAKVPGYRRFGGVFPETAALTHVLAHHGRKVGEGAVLAAAGGIGFSYNVYPGEWGLHVSLGFEVPAGAGVLARAACDRLGVPAAVDETGNATVAERRLLEILQRERPVLLWGARGRLPWFSLREDLVPLVAHQWVVFGFDPDDDAFQVADLAPDALRVSRSEMAAARSALFSAKHRRLTVTEDAVEPVDPVVAARRGLRSGVEALQRPLLPGQGLPGLARWADLLVDNGDAKGWPKMFGKWSGAHFYDALVSIYQAVEVTSGGGALRGLFSDFLERAGALEASGHYRELAEAWSDLARAALPAEVPQLGRARKLLSRRDRLFREQGAEVASELGDLDRALALLRERAETAPILTEAESEELRRDLSRRVLDLHRGERVAAEALAAWLDDS